MAVFRGELCLFAMMISLSPTNQAGVEFFELKTIYSSIIFVDTLALSSA